MNKKSRMNLIVSLICTCLVVCSLYFMYDVFSFHTYGDVQSFDYVLSLNNDQIKLNGLEVFNDNKILKMSDYSLSLENLMLKEQQNYQVIISLNDIKNKASHQIINQFTYSNGQSKIRFQQQSLQFDITDLSKAYIQIKCDQEMVYQHALNLIPTKKLLGSNKEYRLVQSCVAPYDMKLGYLTTTNKDIIKQYPYVSLEYRYLKNKKKSKDNDNNYIVFKKISGLSKDIINNKKYQYYHQDKELGRLDQKDLSVVVIFSKDNGKTFVFKMDLSLEAGE